MTRIGSGRPLGVGVEVAVGVGAGVGVTRGMMIRRATGRASCAAAGIAATSPASTAALETVAI
jgi:hypothetical protein